MLILLKSTELSSRVNLEVNQEKSFSLLTTAK